MTTDIPLITCDNDSVPTTDLIDFFALKNESDLWNPEVLLYSDFLEKLVFRISRKPKALLAHTQRIYYCFHAKLDEQLFAAIVDFLIVLNKRGKAISQRIIMGAKPRLTVMQFESLQQYLQNDTAHVNSLVGNRYCLFTKGLIGVSDMVSPVEKQYDENYDPLAIARDHIEYSQLDEARQVLEIAVLERPTRWDFQEDLLDLYRSTRDTDSFNAMFTQLIESGITLNDKWHTLNNYFKGQNNNG
jgi:hypothetical protein